VISGYGYFARTVGAGALVPVAVKSPVYGAYTMHELANTRSE
jgi:hypothetical protein